MSSTHRTGKTLVRCISKTQRPEGSEIEWIPIGRSEPPPESFGIWFGTWEHKDITVSVSPNVGSVAIPDDGDDVLDGGTGENTGHTPYPGTGAFLGVLYLPDDPPSGSLLMFRGSDGDWESPAVGPDVYKSRDLGLTWTEMPDPSSAWGTYPSTAKRYFGKARQVYIPGLQLVLGLDLFPTGWSTSDDFGESWANWQLFDDIPLNISGLIVAHTIHWNGQAVGVLCPDATGSSTSVVVLRCVGDPRTPSNWSASMLRGATFSTNWKVFGGGLYSGNDIWIVGGLSMGDGSVQRNLSPTLDPGSWENFARRVVSEAFEDDVYEGEGPQTVVFNPSAVRYFPNGSGGGRWWLLWTDQALVYSDDDGVTWNKSLCDHASPSGAAGMHPFFDYRGETIGATSVRPKIIEMAQDQNNPDRLICVGATYAREGITNPRAVYSVSQDGGDTWSPPGQLPITAQVGEPGQIGQLFIIGGAS